MNFAFSAEEEAFRLEVREFFADWQGLDGYFLQGQKWPQVKRLFRALGERGWLSLCWPRRHGGSELPPSYEYLLWDEAAYARAARNPLSAGIVARTLLRHGSEAQQREWLPAIRSGEMHFSLAYSEPEAGSDLASLRTRADREGDFYRVTGQKCWQSYAQDMDALWLLCRSGEPDSRGAGLSLLIVPIDTPGVEVRALPTLDGDQLNEIRLDDVRVPVAARVGAENGAWQLMAEALADERHIQFPPGRLRRDVEEMFAWLDDAGLSESQSIRALLAKGVVRAREAEAHALVVLDTMGRGRPAIAEAAANKIAHTRAAQEIARAVVDCGGPAALVRGARPELLWCQSLWETIGGGTTEIMRGVVAKHALGLGGRS